MTVQLVSGEIQVEITEQSWDPWGCTTVVRVSGEIDLCAAPAFKDMLDLAVEPGVDVIIDMAGVEFIDCSGISVLVEAANRANQWRGSLVVRGLRPCLALVFAILSLDRFLEGVRS